MRPYYSFRLNQINIGTIQIVFKLGKDIHLETSFTLFKTKFICSHFSCLFSVNVSVFENFELWGNISFVMTFHLLLVS